MVIGAATGAEVAELALVISRENVAVPEPDPLDETPTRWLLASWPGARRWHAVRGGEMEPRLGFACGLSVDWSERLTVVAAALEDADPDLCLACLYDLRRRSSISPISRGYSRRRTS